MTALLGSPRRRHGSSLLLALILGLVLSVMPVLAPMAEAATPGRMIYIGGWPVGSFLTGNGTYTYCVEPGAVEPKGAQKQSKTVGSLPAYSAYTFDQSGWKGTVTSGPLDGKRLRQINYVLWKHGRTHVRATAVAVQLAVWILRGDPGAKKWLSHHLKWVKSHGGQAHVERAESMVAEARSKAVVATAPKPAPLKIVSGEQPGEGAVTYPAGTTFLKIEGGEFAGGQTQVNVNGGKGGSVNWRADLDEQWQGEHTVEITGKWSLSSNGWPAKVTIHPPAVSFQQRLAAGVGPTTSTFSGKLSAEETVETNFQPVLSTRVPDRILAAGLDRFSDRVELDSAEGSEPWPSRLGSGGVKQFVPIVAEGVVYGPFSTPQKVSNQAPPGAPIAGRARVLADRGPGEYAVTSEDVARESGYYYWVWSIREESQAPEVRASRLLPEEYRFSDDFGLVDEGHVVPTTLRWHTRLEERRLTAPEHPGARFELRDRLVVRQQGEWIRDASGANIPVRIRLTVYRSDGRPAQSSAPPREATEIAHRVVELRQATPGGGPSTRIALPARTRGWVTVQACLREDDQPKRWRGYVEEWCDDYGIPAESARIIAEAERPSGQARLAETGSGSGPTEQESVPLLGIGLVYSGVSSLLIGSVARQVGRRRARLRAHR